MSNRYEPGPTCEYGASGIARDGMAKRYATAMWRDNPAAFFLHPEGPLSDAAPDDYFVPRPVVPLGMVLVDSLNGCRQNAGLTGAGMPDTYRGWLISHDRTPVPWRILHWEAKHRTNSGAEVLIWAATREELIEKIDAWILKDNTRIKMPEMFYFGAPYQPPEVTVLGKSGASHIACQ